MPQKRSSSSSKRLAAIAKKYVVAVTFGLRQGELFGLRWEDVDLERRRLTVRRQLLRSRDSSGMIVVPTKNDQEQEGPCHPAWVTAVEALKAHRERQAEHIASAKGHWRDPDLVFASTIGTPLDPSNLVDRSFKLLLKRTGLPDIRFHDLRHIAGKKKRQLQDRPRHLRACQPQHDPWRLQPRAGGHEGRGRCGYGQHVFLSRLVYGQTRP
jgi:integrase